MSQAGGSRMEPEDWVLIRSRDIPALRVIGRTSARVVADLFAEGAAAVEVDGRTIAFDAPYQSYSGGGVAVLASWVLDNQEAAMRLLGPCASAEGGVQIGTSQPQVWAWLPDAIQPDGVEDAPAEVDRDSEELSCAECPGGRGWFEGMVGAWIPGARWIEQCSECCGHRGMLDTLESYQRFNDHRGFIWFWDDVPIIEELDSGHGWWFQTAQARARFLEQRAALINEPGRCISCSMSSGIPGVLIEAGQRSDEYLVIDCHRCRAARTAAAAWAAFVDRTGFLGRGLRVDQEGFEVVDASLDLLLSRLPPYNHDPLVEPPVVHDPTMPVPVEAPRPQEGAAADPSTANATEPIIRTVGQSMETGAARLESILRPFARRWGCRHVLHMNDHRNGGYLYQTALDAQRDVDPYDLAVVYYMLPGFAFQHLNASILSRRQAATSLFGVDLQSSDHRTIRDGLWVSGLSPGNTPSWLPRDAKLLWDLTVPTSPVLVGVQHSRCIYIAFDLPHASVHDRAPLDLLHAILTLVDPALFRPTPHIQEFDMARDDQPFRQFWQDAYTHWTEETTAQVAMARSNITGYRRILADAEKQLKAHQAVLAIQEEKFRRVDLANQELAGIRSHPQVERCRLTAAGFDVYTKPLALDWKGFFWPLGSFRIRIGRSGVVQVYSHHPPAGRKTSQCHPHIGPGGEPCWGNLSKTVTEYCLKGEIMALVALTIHYLQSYAGEGYYTRLEDGWCKGEATPEGAPPGPKKRAVSTRLEMPSLGVGTQSAGSSVQVVVEDGETGTGTNSPTMY